MKMFAMVGVIGTLAGCAQPSLSAASVTGNEDAVSIGNVVDEAAAMRGASQYCAQRGMMARFTHMEGYTAFYDCVPRAQHPATPSSP